MSIEEDVEDIYQVCCSEGCGGAVSRVLTERKQMLDNLTATQTRCTELINRVRLQTPEHLQTLAKLVLSGHVHSYVEAAEKLSRYVLEGK